MMYNKFVFVMLLINFCLIRAFLPSESLNVLNICHDPSDQCSFYFHETLPGMSVSTYLADRLMNVQKVMDCGETIWEAAAPATRLSLMKIFRRDGINKLALLYTITRFYHHHRFYEKRNYNWLEITHGYFEYKMEKLKKERILNLKGYLDPRMYHVDEHNLYGMPAMVIVPYLRYEITRVEYDFEILWERQFGRGKCTSVILHGNFKAPKLIHIHIKHIECHEEIFYLFCENKFKAVTKYYFYHVLNHLDRTYQGQEEQESSDEST